MGINGLIPFLKKNALDAFSTITLNTFSKQRVAVDISLFMYKYKVVYGEDWISGVIQLFTTLRENAIHPIVVFDGEAPQEKLEEQKNRRLMREERNSKCQSLMTRIDEYNKDGVISTELQEFYDKTIVNLSKRNDFLLIQQVRQYPKFDINMVSEKVSKMKNQNVRVTYKDIQLVHDLLKVMRIQSIQAPTEAEALCAWLAVKNIVAAVLTEDTDVLAYGTPMFLNKINTNTNSCTLVDYKTLLSSLNLTKEQFTELCILCGCDYNQRVKNVGPARIYKFLQKYNTFDNIVENETKYDFSCIQMNTVKTLFLEQDCIENVIKQVNAEEWYSGAPNFKEIEAFLKEYKAFSKPEKVYNACLQDARDFDVIPANYKKRGSPGTVK
jgi:flap endonuclease-1